MNSNIEHKTTQKTVRLSIGVSEEMYNTLLKISQAEQRSLSATVKILLQESLINRVRQ